MNTVAKALEDGSSILELVGGVAAAFAIVAGILGAVTWLYRYLRRRKLLARLRGEVRAIRNIDDSLRDTTWKMEHLFSNGFPWTGYAIFTGADERLRGDLERLAEGLRQVIPLYIWGIVASYRGNYPTAEKVAQKAAKEGTVHIPPSATGREPTRTLRLGDRGRVRDLRLHLRVLFRSVTMRLNLYDLTDVPFGLWPIDMAEAYQEEAKLRVDIAIPYET